MIAYELFRFVPYALALAVGIGVFIYIFHAPLARLLGRSRRGLEQGAKETEDAYHEEAHPPTPKEEP